MNSHGPSPELSWIFSTCDLNKKIRGSGKMMPSPLFLNLEGATYQWSTLQVFLDTISKMGRTA